MQKAIILSEKEYADMQRKVENLQSDIDLKTLQSVKLQLQHNADADNIGKLRMRIAEFECVIKERESKINAILKDFEGTERTLKVTRSERDAERTFRQNVQEELSRCQAISRRRLETMNHLQRVVQDLKNEQVCIATNPQTGTTRIVSVAKADTYRKFGWIVTEVGLVDRPA